MSLGRSISSGFVGAAVLTLVHEVVRRVVPKAPRMDILGKEALARIMIGAGKQPPDKATLHRLAMSGDLASNTLFYSLVGAGRTEGTEIRGLLLGVLAGAGAVLLPGPLGLHPAASGRTTITKVITVALYTLGGVSAAATFRLLDRRSSGVM